MLVVETVMETAAVVVMEEEGGGGEGMLGVYGTDVAANVANVAKVKRHESSGQCK